LENSSFLVSSAHPDESLHGAGFVARLSGSTAEFMSIWSIMMAGKQPFFVSEGTLGLKLAPILPGWLFSEKGEITFKFLGQCTVTYHNPDRHDTFDPKIKVHKMILHQPDGKTQEIPGQIIPAPYAEAVRSGQISQIDVFFKK